MKVSIVLPRLYEADVEYDAKQGVITLRPHFQSMVEQKTLAYIVVTGDGGATRRYKMAITGNKGKLTTFSEKRVVTGFDSAGTVPVDTPEDAGEEAPE